MMLKIDLSQEIKDVQGNSIPWSLDVGSLAKFIGSAKILRGDLEKPEGYAGPVSDKELVTELSEVEPPKQTTLKLVFVEALLSDARPGEEKKKQAAMDKEDLNKRSMWALRLEDSDILECDDTTAAWIMDLVRERWHDRIILYARANAAVEEARMNNKQ